MGRNPALDGSIDALANAYTALRTQTKSPEVFSAYANALRCLRMVMETPETAQTPETLCAIYLVMICQVSRILHILQNRLHFAIQTKTHIMFLTP